MSDAIIEMMNFKQDIKNYAEITADLVAADGTVTKSMLNSDVILTIIGCPNMDELVEVTEYKITGVEEIKRYYEGRNESYIKRPGIEE